MPDTFSVKVGEFEGPLPLLLDLVEKRQLPISQVSLAEVAENFLDYLRQLNEPSTAVLAEFLVVASTLMLIKSASLLPSLALSESESQEIGDLEERLKLYRMIHQAALGLQARFGRRPIFYTEARRQETVVFSPTSEISSANLLTVMKNLIRSLPPFAETLPRLAVKKMISLEEMITELTGRVQTALRISFSDFIVHKSADWRKEKTNVIISFLALLELCKRGLVEVRQGKHFAEINIETKITETPRY